MASGPSDAVPPAPTCDKNGNFGGYLLFVTAVTSPKAKQNHEDGFLENGTLQRRAERVRARIRYNKRRKKSAQNWETMNANGGDKQKQRDSLILVISYFFIVIGSSSTVVVVVSGSSFCGFPLVVRVGRQRRQQGGHPLWRKAVDLLGVAVDGELVGGEGTSLVRADDGDTNLSITDAGDDSLVLGRLPLMASGGEDRGRANRVADQEDKGVVQTRMVLVVEARTEDEDLGKDEHANSGKVDRSNLGENLAGTTKGVGTSPD
ncbi:hypothetical protein BKA70DRAFT_1231982 [Coprinopsis sp. MPI-PUGE-AT-0042]|nr:hypothetical protein BKA70DRAFT_1231982 [Coprinopsis sp. MPI-PUGE-AT-0042]